MAENQLVQRSLLLTLADIISLWKRPVDQEIDYTEVVSKAAIDNMESGVILLDAQNKVLDLNTRAKQIIGSASRNKEISYVKGKTARAALDIWPNLVSYLYSSNKQYQALLKFALGDEMRYYDVQVNPVYQEREANTRNRNSDGNMLIGRYIVLIDSSEREHAKHALQERKKQLRSMVEQLRKADRYQAALADSVQQELNEPLERLNALINSLEQQTMPDGLKQHVNQLKREAQSMHKIVEEMGVFSHHRRPPSFYAEPTLKATTVLPDRESLHTESFH